LPVGAEATAQLVWILAPRLTDGVTRACARIPMRTLPGTFMRVGERSRIGMPIGALVGMFVAVGAALYIVLVRRRRR
jgi:hypothetical protein